MSRRHSIGELLCEAIEAAEQFGVRTECHVAAFVGYVIGQVEKVHLGACKACMVSTVLCDRSLVCCQSIARIYGLALVELDYLNVPPNRPSEVPEEEARVQEIWLCQRRWRRAVEKLRTMTPNAPAWHRLRAKLCGIPKARVDIHFHKS